MDPRAAVSRGRVLVVDDDVTFADIVSDVLREAGYEVTCEHSPLEAIAQASEGDFAAAVLDLVLPELGGLQLAERIRSVSPDTQILILTGHADLGSAIEGIQHGVFDYLPKGSSRIGRLQHSLERAVERWRLARQNRELVDRLHRSNVALRRLRELGTELAQETHVARLLERLVAGARELCRARAGRALLLERTAAGEWLVEAGAGDGASALLGARLKSGEGILLQAAEKDEPTLVADPRASERFARRTDELGAEPGLIAVPLRHHNIAGVLAVAGAEGGGFSVEETDLLANLARQAGAALQNALEHERSLNFFTHTSELLVSVLESLDVFYPGHSRRVAALSDMVTRRLGMSEVERRHIHFGALLHDIGKVRVGRQVLESKERWNDALRERMQQHPLLGCEMLRPIALWEDVLPIIAAHHERWDGKGYPRGLTGEEIPLGARVVAVADAFDAMTRSTPHGGARSPEEALNELEGCAGTQFDPRVVRLFVAEYNERGHQLRD
ncbi:MAG TPA: HD domain-containing phosphohydrolase [Vicinamibacteria bacterium]